MWFKKIIYKLITKKSKNINTPLYGLKSVPLITMIEQNNFEQVMKYIATIPEHNFL